MDDEQALVANFHAHFDFRRLQRNAGGAALLAQLAANDDEDETDEKGPEMVSLDEVEAAEDDADPTPEDDSVEDGDSS
ncbi:hypothetical protein OMR07_22675, partial [Methylobacterium organophilum]|nr:hypothetical protein [Methylobacterium organophilum]